MVVENPRAQQALCLHPSALQERRQPEERRQSHPQPAEQRPAPDHAPIAGQVAHQQHPQEQQGRKEEAKQVMAEDQRRQPKRPGHQETLLAPPGPARHRPQNQRRERPGHRLRQAAAVEDVVGHERRVAIADRCDHPRVRAEKIARQAEHKQPAGDHPQGKERVHCHRPRQSESVEQRYSHCRPRRSEDVQRKAEPVGHIRRPTRIPHTLRPQVIDLHRTPEVKDVVVPAGEVGAQQRLHGRRQKQQERQQQQPRGPPPPRAFHRAEITPD